MELLAPAGTLQKLKFAINYGADAVYLAGKQFGLRAQSKNFSSEEILEAVDFCHKLNRKVYITVNIFAHNSDLKQLPEYLRFLQEAKVDALIVADPAVFSMAKKHAPEIPIHISTQANITSWESAAFWQELGAERVILARELSLPEIREIKENLPDLELEMFVHGAMCMSYSGRCLLSSYLNNRSANQGACSQPCRWEYQLVEQTRPGEYFPVMEDERGTYIMNSKDLCLLNRLKEIKEAGIDSIKIEGRMKSLYYVANVSRVYKEALKLVEQGLEIPIKLNEELEKVSHRVYTEGFIENMDSTDTQYHKTSKYIREYQFVGEVVDSNEKSLFIDIKAKFSIGDIIEVIFPDRDRDFTINVTEIFDANGNEIPFTKPNTTVRIDVNEKIPPFGIVRIKLPEDMVTREG